MSADASALVLLRQAPTGADPALVLADDGNSYWVKAMGNPHGATSLLAERLVGLAGEWLGAPVAPSRLIDVPPMLAATWGFQSGARAQPGPAHGSLVVGSRPVELAELTHHGKDGNATRGAIYVALWEWCIGEDAQFLYDTAASMSMWSIDHGLWIGGGGEWDTSVFDNPCAYQPRWTGPVSAMSRSAFLGAADRLDSFTLDDARAVSQGVPLEWGFTQNELEAAAGWLYARAARVAARMRLHSASATKD